MRFSDKCFLIEHMNEKHTVVIDLADETPESQDLWEGRLECFVRGHIDSRHDNQDNHMQDKHINEVQTLYCKKCKFTAKDNDSMKDHETTPNHNKSNSKVKCRNSSECRWFRQGRCNFDHEGSPAPNVNNVKECRNGVTCHKKSQGRCSFYHQDVGVQQVRQTWSRSDQRPTPSSQWKTIQPSRPQNQQQQIPIPSLWQTSQTKVLEKTLSYRLLVLAFK